jgi:uncharacterized protein
MPLFRLMLILVLTAPAAFARESMEYWHGRAGNPTHGVTIDVRIVTTAAGQRGAISLHELAAAEIPLRRVSRTPDRLELELEIEKAVMVFSGTIHDGTAAGTYAMGPMRGTFELTRASAPDAAYRQEEVRFESAAGVVLAGTLLLPKRQTRVPATVFLHGSGRMTRDGNRFIAERLASSGVAALIYDKRGSGASTGDLAASDFHDLAADAAAAVLFLRQRSEIDPANIGFAGASQAGWIGTMAAAELRDVAFFAFTSAPVVTVARESWWDYEARLRNNNASEAEIAAAREILRLDDEVTRTGAGWDELQRLLDQAKGQPWFAAMEFSASRADDPRRIAFRRIMDIDPMPLLRTLEVPALWVYGGRDVTVPADWSIENLIALVKEGKEYTIRVFPQGDHAMTTLPPDLATGGWPRRIPQHAPLVTDWVVHQAAQRATKRGAERR